MRSQQMDIGIARISRWQIDDEQHLPRDGVLTQRFLPEAQSLNQILMRPSLDERLTSWLEPKSVDGELLDPSVLSESCLGALEVFHSASRIAEGDTKIALQRVVELLTNEVNLNHEIRTALAALLQG